MANKPAKEGEATPAGGNGTQTIAEMEHNIDTATDSILKKYGIKATPAAAAETPEAKAKREAAAGAETPEAKAAREAEEAAAAETPEAKATREAAEAAGAETPEAKAAREAEEAAAGETPEQKTAREAGEAEEAETEKVVKARLKDLPAEHQTLVQTVITERVGKVIAKERDAKEAAEAKTAEAETRANNLETELAEARKSGGGGPVVVEGMHPLFLVKTAADIDNYEAELEASLLWAAQHPDGYEAQNAQEKTISAEQVKQRAYELRLEQIRIIPKARRLLTERETADAPLRKTLPALFKAGKEENRTAQALRKLLPELDRLGNANELIARLILGEKALKQLANPPAKVITRTEPRKAPRTPGGGGPAKGAAGEQPEGKSASEATSKAMANPGDKNAFRAAILANI